MSMFRDLQWPADRVRRTLLAQVKDVTRQIIEVQYPLWKQQNISAACVEAGAKTADFESMKLFVDAKRQKSNDVETQIAGLDDEQIYDFDVEQALKG